MKYTATNLQKLKKDELIQIILKAQNSYIQLQQQVNKNQETPDIIKPIKTWATLHELTAHRLTVQYRELTLSIKVQSDAHYEFINKQLQGSQLPIKLIHKQGYAKPTFQVIQAKEIN